VYFPRSNLYSEDSLTLCHILNTMTYGSRRYDTNHLFPPFRAVAKRNIGSLLLILRLQKSIDTQERSLVDYSSITSMAASVLVVQTGALGLFPPEKSLLIRLSLFLFDMIWKARDGGVRA
jgi:hypothetical protein